MKIDIAKNELFITSVNRAMRSFINRSVLKKYHGRPYDGFILILGGECRYEFDDGMSFVAREGDLLYLANNSVYDMFIECDRYSFVCFDFVFSDERDRRSAVYNLPDKDEARLIFDKILLTFEAKSSGWQSECASLFYRIYSRIIKSKATYNSSSSRVIAERARQYFLENLYKSDLSVADAAHILGISQTHLRRIFSSVFSKSPSKYVTDARILKSKELMEFSYLSLSDIAEQCGFSSLPYFSKVFKGLTGTSPAAYRRSLRGADVV